MRFTRHRARGTGLGSAAALLVAALLLVYCTRLFVAAAPSAQPVVYRPQYEPTTAAVGATIDLEFAVAQTTSSTLFLTIQLTCTNDGGVTSRDFPDTSLMQFTMGSSASAFVSYTAPLTATTADVCSVSLGGPSAASWSYLALNASGTGFETPDEVATDATAFVIIPIARGPLSFSRIDSLRTSSFSSLHGMALTGLRKGLAVTPDEKFAFLLTTDGFVHQLDITTGIVTAFGANRINPNDNYYTDNILVATNLNLFVVSSLGVVRYTIAAADPLSTAITIWAPSSSTDARALARDPGDGRIYLCTQGSIFEITNADSATGLASTTLKLTDVTNLSSVLNFVIGQGRAILSTDSTVFRTSDLRLSSATLVSLVGATGVSTGISSGFTHATLSADGRIFLYAASSPALFRLDINDPAGISTFTSSEIDPLPYGLSSPTHVKFGDKSTSYVFVHMTSSRPVQPYNANQNLFAFTLDTATAPSLTLTFDSTLAKALTLYASTSAIMGPLSLTVSCTKANGVKIAVESGGLLYLTGGTQSLSFAFVPPALPAGRILCIGTPPSGRDAGRFALLTPLILSGGALAGATLTSPTAPTGVRTNLTLTLPGPPIYVLSVTITCACVVCTDSTDPFIVFSGSGASTLVADTTTTVTTYEFYSWQAMGDQIRCSVAFSGASGAEFMLPDPVLTTMVAGPPIPSSSSSSSSTADGSVTDDLSSSSGASDGSSDSDSGSSAPSGNSLTSSTADDGSDNGSSDDGSSGTDSSNVASSSAGGDDSSNVASSSAGDDSSNVASSTSDSSNVNSGSSSATDQSSISSSGDSSATSSGSSTDQSSQSSSGDDSSVATSSGSSDVASSTANSGVEMSTPDIGALEEDVSSSSSASSSDEFSSSSSGAIAGITGGSSSSASSSDEFSSSSSGATAGITGGSSSSSSGSNDADSSSSSTTSESATSSSSSGLGGSASSSSGVSDFSSSSSTGSGAMPSAQAGGATTMLMLLVTVAAAVLAI